MLSYNVKYKRKGQWFWRKIRNVIEDGISIPTDSLVSYRYFLSDEKILDIIPAGDTTFKFGCERAEMIEERETLKKRAEGNA